jgi:hypothetical protein
MKADRASAQAMFQIVKGAPFTLWGALFYLGKSATMQELCAFTTYKHQAAELAMAVLAGQGIAQRQGRRGKWYLTSLAEQLWLFGGPKTIAENQQLAAGTIAENQQSDILRAGLDSIAENQQLQIIGKAKAIQAVAEGKISIAENQQSDPLTTTIDIDKESNLSTVVVQEPVEAAETAKNMLIALRSAHIFPNLCQRLADDLLAEDGPAWLHRVLGWIATEHGQDARTRGATIYEALKARAFVPDESFLPPEGMPFRQALTWAERGGPLAGDPNETDEDRALHRFDGYLQHSNSGEGESHA